MNKQILVMMILVIICSVQVLGCVEQNPKHPVVIQEVKDGLQAEFSEDLAMIKKITIFENTLKVTMLEEYPEEKLEAFAKGVTKIFGYRMRANKLRSSRYFIEIYQRKQVGTDKKMKKVAQCNFENSTDRIDVELLGLGEDKYRGID